MKITVKNHKKGDITDLHVFIVNYNAMMKELKLVHYVEQYNWKKETYDVTYINDGNAASIIEVMSAIKSAYQESYAEKLVKSTFVTIESGQDEKKRVIMSVVNKESIGVDSWSARNMFTKVTKQYETMFKKIESAILQ